MKIFGFLNDIDKPELLDQVTLEINPDELRELAKFLSLCADEIDDDEEWEHEHLCDYLGRELEQDLVVYNAKKVK